MRALIPLVATIALVSPASTQAQAPARSFTIGGEAFSESEILDARAQPDLDGHAAILVSFDEKGSRKLARITRAFVGRKLAILLNGSLLVEAVVQEPLESGQFQLSGAFSLDEAERIAWLVSGKEPLPESLEE